MLQETTGILQQQQQQQQQYKQHHRRRRVLQHSPQDKIHSLIRDYADEGEEEGEKGSSFLLGPGIIVPRKKQMADPGAATTTTTLTNGLLHVRSLPSRSSLSTGTRQMASKSLWDVDLWSSSNLEQQQHQQQHNKQQHKQEQHHVTPASLSYPPPPPPQTYSPRRSQSSISHLSQDAASSRRRWRRSSSQQHKQQHRLLLSEEKEGNLFLHSQPPKITSTTKHTNRPSSLYSTKRHFRTQSTSGQTKSTTAKEKKHNGKSGSGGPNDDGVLTAVHQYHPTTRDSFLFTTKPDDSLLMSLGEPEEGTEVIFFPPPKQPLHQRDDQGNNNNDYNKNNDIDSSSSVSAAEVVADLANIFGGAPMKGRRLFDMENTTAIVQPNNNKHHQLIADRSGNPHSTSNTSSQVATSSEAMSVNTSTGDVKKRCFHLPRRNLLLQKRLASPPGQRRRHTPERQRHSQEEEEEKGIGDKMEEEKKEEPSGRAIESFPTLSPNNSQSYSHNENSSTTKKRSTKWFLRPRQTQLRFAPIMSEPPPPSSHQSVRQRGSVLGNLLLETSHDSGDPQLPTMTFHNKNPPSSSSPAQSSLLNASSMMNSQEDMLEDSRYMYTTEYMMAPPPPPPPMQPDLSLPPSSLEDQYVTPRLANTFRQQAGTSSRPSPYNAVKTPSQGQDGEQQQVRRLFMGRPSAEKNPGSQSLMKLTDLKRAPKVMMMIPPMMMTTTTPRTGVVGGGTGSSLVSNEVTGFYGPGGIRQDPRPVREIALPTTQASPTQSPHRASANANTTSGGGGPGQEPRRSGPSNAKPTVTQIRNQIFDSMASPSPANSIEKRRGRQDLGGANDDNNDDYRYSGASPGQRSIEEISGKGDTNNNQGPTGQGEGNEDDLSTISRSAESSSLSPGTQGMHGTDGFSIKRQASCGDDQIPIRSSPTSPTFGPCQSQLGLQEAFVNLIGGGGNKNNNKKTNNNRHDDVFDGIDESSFPSAEDESIGLNALSPQNKPKVCPSDLSDLLHGGPPEQSRHTPLHKQQRIGTRRILSSEGMHSRNSFDTKVLFQGKEVPSPNRSSGCLSSPMYKSPPRNQEGGTRTRRKRGGALDCVCVETFAEGTTMSDLGTTFVTTTREVSSSPPMLVSSSSSDSSIATNAETEGCRCLLLPTSFGGVETSASSSNKKKTKKGQQQHSNLNHHQKAKHFDTNNNNNPMFAALENMTRKTSRALQSLFFQRGGGGGNGTRQVQ